MYILIVGAGKVGYFLAKRLCVSKHTVSIIERDKVVCEAIAKELDALVINGDGCEPQILEEAGIGGVHFGPDDVAGRGLLGRGR